MRFDQCFLEQFPMGSPAMQTRPSMERHRSTFARQRRPFAAKSSNSGRSCAVQAKAAV
jgi:hypothetical protein